jgi:hypothetical protein
VAISNYMLCNLAARLMRANLLLRSQDEYDPAVSAAPSVKVYVEAARKELASRQPITIDCGTTFDDQPQEAA